jgi:hypothetical protein
MQHDTHRTRNFRVRLGHLQVVVRARDPSDAIALARKHWGMELPRLWDVIYQKREQEFVVEELA